MAPTRHSGSTDRIPWDGMPLDVPVSELMNRQFTAVGPRADWSALLSALRRRPHDPLPVVDAEGRVLGLVGAADLVARLALRELPPRGAHVEAREVRVLRRRADGVMARELMTTPVRCVAPTTPAPEAAALALQHGLHQLLVTDDQNRPVGLVCLCDLIGAMRRDDAEIRSEVLYLAVAPEAGADRAALRVDCDHGRIRLDARTARRSQAAALLDRVRAVEGVVQVADALCWDVDDLALILPGASA